MSRQTETLLMNALVLVVALLTAFPLVWMLSVSFMTPGEAAVFPPPLWPKHATFENYVELFARGGMGRYVFNSFLISTCATLLALTFNVTAGYAFAKMRFAGRDAVFGILLGALIIPAQVGMMPLFLMLKSMGVINTYAGALVPWIASVFGIFLVRQFALSIPDEMIEAARVDGASEFRIFRSIVMPVLQPVLVTVALFTFLTSWNDFMWPLIVLTGEQNYTLPVALAALSREHVQDNEMMMAGAVVTTIPVLLLFLALQRFYIQGMLSGSVKG